MMTFEQALQSVDSVGISGTYNPPALRTLWEGLERLPKYAVVVEIGCEYGRSTSLILQRARDMEFGVYVIDCFVGDGVRAKFERVTKGFSFELLPTTSQKAASHIPPMDFLHVDGDHTHDGVETDCRLYLPKLLPKGLAAFHDYGYHDTPDVKLVVDQYTKGWPVIADGGTCHIVRKP